MFLTEEPIIKVIIERNFWDYGTPIISALISFLLSASVLLWIHFRTKNDYKKSLDLLDQSNKIAKFTSKENFKMLKQSNKIAEFTSKENFKILEQRNKIALFDKKYEIYMNFILLVEKYQAILFLIQKSVKVELLNTQIKDIIYSNELADIQKISDFETTMKMKQPYRVSEQFKFIFKNHPNNINFIDIKLFTIHMSIFVGHFVKNSKCIYTKKTIYDSYDSQINNLNPNTDLLKKIVLKKDILDDPKLETITLDKNLFNTLFIIKDKFKKEKIDELILFLEQEITLY